MRAMIIKTRTLKLHSYNAASFTWLQQLLILNVLVTGGLFEHSEWETDARREMIKIRATSTY
jgi:hypothetical protein